MSKTECEQARSQICLTTEAIASGLIAALGFIFEIKKTENAFFAKSEKETLFLYLLSYLLVMHHLTGT